MTEEQKMEIVDNFDEWLNDLVVEYKINKTDLLILKFRIFEKLSDRIHKNGK